MNLDLKKDALIELPQWDLSDLYSGIDSEALQEDLAHVDIKARQFSERFRGQIATIDADELHSAIVKFEELHDLIGRIQSFSELTFSSNLEDPNIGAFYQNVLDRLGIVGANILFFKLELSELEDEALEVLFDDSYALSVYQPWLRNMRVFRPHQLELDLERLIYEKDAVVRTGWTRLFSQTISSLRFKIGERIMSSEQALSLLSDRDNSVRKEAAKELSRVFEENVPTFALGLNILIKDKEIEDRWRGYSEPSSYRHLSNQIEPAVVEALVDAVKNSYSSLSHRYYEIKAAWLGKERMAHWDRNAPLPEEDKTIIPWDRAREIVLQSYQSFSPHMGSIAHQFFERPWIDASVRPGKSPGAFSHPTVPSVHPYILLNYQGRARDVMTLAHELGHGIHQVLANGQGPLLANTPLTLAETASVFGEQLVFRSLLSLQKDKKFYRIMLAGKVEDMLNTVVRQVAFYEFEQRIHIERRKGELTAERLGEIWLDVQSASLGPVFDLGDDYKSYWCYVPHFVHTPFYVYAYAFGDCLVNSLYAVYLEGRDGFQESYLELLKAGGSCRHQDLLAPFGLNASDPGFWSKGLAVISGFIDELNTV